MKRTALSIAVAAAAVTFAGGAQALYLAPYLPGSSSSGQGADAHFVKIDDNWHGSTVLWNEATQTYGQGQPIGSYQWGTGLWGIPDWQAAIGGQIPAVQSWSGTAAQINYGNDLYNTLYSQEWGPASSLPISGQTNWAALFQGYIRITHADWYNFSVLSDDGFFFNLFGANGAQASMSRDYLNPRDRHAFGSLLQLDPGLYRFELGAYNRLEAGVVDLRWQYARNDDVTWYLVPTEHLLGLGLPPTEVSVSDVPEPASALLALLGIGGLACIRRRREPR